MAQSYYLETGSTDPAYNLAFEEFVLKNRPEGDYLILWQNRNAVIVGRNQNALEEINREFVDQHDIHVIRRNTGGGAVYHDLGNLNYSFITDYTDGDTAAGNRFTVTVVQALRELGLDASASGRNDILVSGQKVSGTAQHRSGNRILHHGTLLFDSNPDMISGSLNPDPTKFQSKSVKSVRSRVGNIRASLPRDMDLNEFWNYLKTALARDGILSTSLSAHELAQVDTLKEEKYDTWQWNFGSSPKFDTRISHRFPGGLLQIHLTVKHGRIESIGIYGDFLALRPITELEEALTGVSYRQDAIESTIAPLTLADLIGGITKDEFLRTIMNVRL